MQLAAYHAEMLRLMASERLELFELIRTAVNGNESQARQWFERTRAIAQGKSEDSEDTAIVIASEEDAAKFLRSLGR